MKFQVLTLGFRDGAESVRQRDAPGHLLDVGAQLGVDRRCGVDRARGVERVLGRLPLALARQRRAEPQPGRDVRRLQTEQRPVGLLGPR